MWKTHVLKTYKNKWYYLNSIKKREILPVCLTSLYKIFKMSVGKITDIFTAYDGGIRRDNIVICIIIFVYKYTLNVKNVKSANERSRLENKTN